MRPRYIKIIFSIVALAALTWGVINWQNLRDQVAVSSYNPSAEIEAIANRTTMTDQAKQIFYATNPTIDEKAEFNANCPQKEGGINVLGCYQSGFLSAGKISLFKIEDPRLVDEIDVTAAHELLHAVYQRLSFWERERIDGLLKAVATSPRVKLTEVMRNYVAENNYNELHSHIGTEFDSALLSSELNDYYAQYFSNRGAIVSVHQGNETLFAQCEQDGKSMRLRIDSTKASIDSYRAQLDSMRAQMDRHRANGDTDEYNAMVPRYNQVVNQYNTAVNRYNSLIKSYNSLVDRCNALSHSYDSKIETIPSR